MPRAGVIHGTEFERHYPPQILSHVSPLLLSWELYHCCHSFGLHSRNGNFVSSGVKLHQSCSQERQERRVRWGREALLISHHEHITMD